MFRSSRTLKAMVAVLALTSIISFSVPAYGAGTPPENGEVAELSMYVGQTALQYFPDQQIGTEQWGHICRGGPDTAIQMDFVLDLDNLNVTSIGVQSYHAQNNNPTDFGSITYTGDWATPNIDRTFTWNGTLENNQCIVFYLIGEVTGEIGTNAFAEWNIASSTLQGGIDNANDNPVDNTDSFTVPISGSGDLALETRLVTTGDINLGDTVTYEIYLKNVSSQYPMLTNVLGVFYLMPEGSTFGSFTDLDLDDGLSALGCMPVPEEELPPGLPYAGIVMQCGVSVDSGTIPVNSSFPFAFSMTASQAFGDGTAEVIGVGLNLSGGEEDSSTFVYSLMLGQDAFALNLNNIMRLTYNPNELTVTINRCTGLAAVVSTNDACFTVEFNKIIYAPTFTIDDIVLSPAGHVYSFVQDSPTKWTIRVNQLEVGKTLTVTVDPASVQDYSAVLNGTQVLGVNTIRYEVENNSAGGDSGTDSESQTSGESSTTKANGKLARTGIETGDSFSFAVLLVLLGFAILGLSRKVVIKKTA